MSAWAVPAITAAAQLYGTQYQADSMNRRAARVARETNALNYKMFQEGNMFNEYMFDKANRWNSPANQRKMLEEAGYNPAMLFDANIGAANPVSSASPNAAQGYTPSVPDYGTIGLNAIQSYLALKQAKKVDAETLGQQIENGYKAETLSANLALIGAQTGNLDMVTKGQKLKNIVDEASLEPDILLREEQANKALADADFAALRTKQEKLKTDLYELFGPKEAEQQYENLVKQGGVLDAQKQTIIDEGNKYKAEGAAATKNAETNRRVGESTIRTNQTIAQRNLAESNKLAKEAYMQQMQNEVYERYGTYIESAKFNKLCQEAKYEEAKAYLLQVDAQWAKDHPNSVNWRKHIDAWFGPLLGTGQSAIGAYGSVKAAEVLAK